MLPSSVRRVVTAAPQCPVVSSLASSAPRAASAYGLSYKPNCHQRRYSSSKPSSPDNDPKDFATRPSVPASGSSKASGEKRKRKAKEASAAPQLPSVPSTRHIKDEALALSTFFALHRPISVTQLLPKPVTNDAFAEIFNQRRGHRVTDVISTLSQTVHDLEQPLAKLNLNDKQQQQQIEQQEAEDGSTRLSLKHADGTETSVYIQLNSMSGHFLPYTPPPPPEPLSDVQAEVEAAAVEEALEESEVPQTRVYKAIVTIEETVDADGQYKVLAHSPQLIEEGSQPRTFLERMALRQLRYEEARQNQDKTMHAISVRRQKKLKMKKKKYKKLMRRTRNLRRKLDRL
ncbi:hypothetical protein QBC46DRAFT_372296 [Diplogelasinospora grovesii]|uniref:Small ribosomal subunit protein mS38 n=1 Tax=Diplogelasinospora grovesii TaxID=303347 RepID=A0AAN6NGQ1_9PEZI|nr:hypothetical protein QBC46DRAFT_372296 [Diplogelasinospora grovesii]